MRVNKLSLLVLSLSLLVCSGGALAQSSGDSSEPQSDAPGSAERPMRVSEGVMAAQLSNKVEAVHPQDAKKVSGAVVMAAKIDPSGDVIELNAISGPEVLRDAALTAGRKWTFRPYLLNGHAVYVATTITIMFYPQQ